MTRALLCIAPLVLLGCPSNDGGNRDPQTSASGGTGVSSGGGNAALTGLENSPFMNEVWIDENGQNGPYIFYPRENIRATGNCRLPNGQFACDAMRFLRNGMPVELTRRALDGRTSAGVKVCMKLRQPIVVVHNSVGAEDSFCKFPDGSMVSNGALERYSMRVIE